MVCPRFVPMFKQYSSPPEGCTDQDYDYYFPFSVTALLERFQQPMIMDPDADFYLRGLMGIPSSAVASVFGALKVKITDPYGNLLVSAYTYMENIFGISGKAAPIWPEIICPASSVLYFDFQDVLNGAAYTAPVGLRGVKRVKEVC